MRKISLEDAITDTLINGATHGIVTGIRQPSTSCLIKTLKTIYYFFKYPAKDIGMFLLDYAATSDYKIRTCKEKTTLSIVNKKYKMLKIENGLTTPWISRVSLVHYTPSMLEASITFNTPRVKPKLDIYLSNITGSYRFDHAKCMGLRHP